MPGSSDNADAPPSPTHWAVLAGTRFFLSLIVFFGHAGGFLGKTGFTAAWEDLGELAAVLAFFVISGFSIAHSIEQRPRGYIVRRLWRIWPTYLFSFFCCTLPVVLLTPLWTAKTAADQTVTNGMILGNLFMLQGLLVPVLEANAATWTLAIEEWCYLAAPLRPTSTESRKHSSPAERPLPLASVSEWPTQSASAPASRVNRPEAAAR